MKPTTKTSNYLAVLCGLLIIFASFATNFQNEAEEELISIDKKMHQPAMHKSTQASSLIVKKKSQDHISNKKQPPLNIVASFIIIEAKSSDQDTEKNVEKNTTQYEKIIYNFIQVFF